MGGMRTLPALRRLVRAGVLLAILAAVPWSLGGGADARAEVRNPAGVAVIVGNKGYEHRDVPEVSFAHRDADAFRRYVVDVLGYDPRTSSICATPPGGSCSMRWGRGPTRRGICGATWTPTAAPRSWCSIRATASPA